MLRKMSIYNIFYVKIYYYFFLIPNVLLNLKRFVVDNNDIIIDRY